MAPHRIIARALGIVVVALAACGDDPVAPAVGGNYAASYTYQASISGQPPNTGTCTGSLTVSGQTGASFSGMFSINPGACSTSSGQFSGTVQENGAVVIDGLVDEWLADEAAAGGVSCALSPDTALRGTFSANVISAASEVVTVTCNGVDFDIELEVTATRS